MTDSCGSSASDGAQGPESASSATTTSTTVEDESLQRRRTEARAKLAYLFSPARERQAVARSDSDPGAAELQEEASPKVRRVLEEREEAAPSPPATEDLDDVSALRAENARLRAELSQRREHEGISILGVKSRQCGGCGKGPGIESRIFVELGKLYCESCWSQWERCGWWRPTMRISNVAPAIGASGLPEFSPEDAFCIPEFMCAHGDLSLMHQLQSELPEGKDFSDWHGARHMGMHFEGSDVSALRLDSAPRVLRETVGKLEVAFGIRASAARLNLYRSSADWKPFHADRGADNEGVPQVTVGLSLGATRELSFSHWQTGLIASFPQNNGDVFAFTPELNRVFVHGVPKVGGRREPDANSDGPRISLILWGSRIVVQRAHDAKKNSPNPPVDGVVHAVPGTEG